MYKIILYCKSYSGDVHLVKRLLQSINKFNKDNIPFYVSCPKREEKLFRDTLGTENYQLIFDEDTYDCKKIFDGWRTQQVVKSNVHRLNICENYYSIDSDQFFIKDFYISDFMCGDTPYTIFNDNKQTQENDKVFFDVDYKNNGYSKAVKAYRDVFGVKGCTKIWDYGPAPYIWSCRVWKSFEDWLKESGMDFEDFQLYMENKYNIAMREAVTYGEYLFATKEIDIIPTATLFKQYHHKEVYEFEEKNGFTDLEKIKLNWIGLGIQSKIGIRTIFDE